MKDFNFFSASIDAAKAARQKRLIIILCAVVFIGMIGGLYYMVSAKANEKEDSISSLKEHLNSVELNTSLKELRSKREEYKLMKDYRDTVETLLADIANADVVTSALFETINSTLPQGVKFNNAMYAPGYVSFNGTADTRVAVAELYRNLLDLGIFSEISIGSISAAEVTESEGAEPEAVFAFDMQCVMKGGAVR